MNIIMSKNYREKYKNIAQSDWFKEHYHNASLNVVAEYPDGSIQKFLLNKINELEDSLNKLEKELENENKVYKRRTGRTG